MTAATEEKLRRKLTATPAMMDRQRLLKQLWRLTRDRENEGDCGKTQQLVSDRGERK